MVPMREAGNQHPLEVRHDRIERFGIFRRGVGERGGDLARLHTREHRVSLRMIEIIGDPVHEHVPVSTEGVGIHETASDRPAEADS